MKKILVDIVEFLLEKKIITHYHFYQGGTDVQLRLANNKVYVMTAELFDIIHCTKTGIRSMTTSMNLKNKTLNSLVFALIIKYKSLRPCLH